MSQSASSVFFNREHAASYNQRFSKLAPMKDALHLLIRLIFSELPTEARILCVGAGTGAEMIYLAEAFPQWQFTAVEPAAAMLDICRQRAEACGITARCTFHEGYIDSLPESETFDAAMAILVSQFILQAEQRQHFFRKIAAQLRPGGLLVSADLSADKSSATYRNFFEIWQRAWSHTGMSAEALENQRAAFDRDVAVLPPDDVAAIIQSSGFAAPMQFFQTLLIHGWYARRSLQA
jgi:tRNA (cmo5U34)-methyltransferase